MVSFVLQEPTVPPNKAWKARPKSRVVLGSGLKGCNNSKRRHRVQAVEDQAGRAGQGPEADSRGRLVLSRVLSQAFELRLNVQLVQRVQRLVRQRPGFESRQEGQEDGGQEYITSANSACSQLETEAT